MFTKYATTKNLTVLGILAILSALAAAGTAIFDGDPATKPDLEILFKDIIVGVGLILAKGASNTGGSVPVTPEAETRVAVAVK